MKDVTHKTTLTALTIVAAATLSSLPAASQPVRPDPPQPDRMPPRETRARWVPRDTLCCRRHSPAIPDESPWGGGWLAAQ